LGRVNGKVAVVTGAASGMGRAHAVALAREGALVVATDMQDDRCRETVAIITATGGKAIFVHHDISKVDDWKAVVVAANKEFGRIQVLVNNAGVYVVAEADQTTLEQWDFVFNINVRGTFIGCQQIIPEMKAAGGGSIINISSNFALVGRAMFSAYCASKGAVRSFTKAIAAELASHNIRANTVHPGLVETDMTRDLIGTQEGLDMILGGAPIRRAAQPEEIANAVIYLASDESAFMTGSELVIDGGYVAV
jgi:cyclopentanol dehydrogenase